MVVASKMKPGFQVDGFFRNLEVPVRELTGYELKATNYFTKEKQDIISVVFRFEEEIPAHLLLLNPFDKTPQTTTIRIKSTYGGNGYYHCQGYLRFRYDDGKYANIELSALQFKYHYLTKKFIY